MFEYMKDCVMENIVKHIEGIIREISCFQKQLFDYFVEYWYALEF